MIASLLACITQFLLLLLLLLLLCSVQPNHSLLIYSPLEEGEGKIAKEAIRYKHSFIAILTLLEALQVQGVSMIEVNKVELRSPMELRRLAGQCLFIVM